LSTADASLEQRLTETFLRLAQGDFSVRMQRPGDRSSEDIIVYLVNVLAEELGERTAQRERERQTLNDSVADLNQTLVDLAAGNFDARARRDFTGSPTDVLAFLVNSCAEEIGALFSETVRQRDQLDLEVRSRARARLSSAAMMAAGLAHEVNNPLAYVLGNAQLATRDLEALEEGLGAPAPGNREALDHLAAIRQSLKDIADGASRIADLVARLKRLSPTSSDELAVIDVRRLVDTSLALVRNMVMHRATLRTEHLPCPQISGDEPALSQVVINLVHNAALAFATGDVSRNEVLVRTATGPDGSARIEVHDNGLGIRADVLPHVFDAFYTTRPVGSGTGLGLPISQQTVLAHGGEITVETALGEGSSFTVTLPPYREPAKDEDVKRDATGRVPGRARVLVIDDEPNVTRMIARLLRAHDVVVENDPVRALKRAREQVFDLIVCDLMMPNLDGQAIYESLAVRAPDVAAKIVFITGGAFTPRVSTFLETIDNEVLTKPFSTEELRGLVAASIPVT